MPRTPYKQTRTQTERKAKNRVSKKECKKMSENCRIEINVFGIEIPEHLKPEIDAMVDDFAKRVKARIVKG